MNAWSRTRKRIILTILILAVVVLVGVPLFFLFSRTPSCSDGLKNGDETGIDCGGSCRKLCTVESLPLLVKGDPRVLRVATNSYEVVALIENANANAEISRARYIFRVYGAQSLVPIKTIEGEAYVPKGATFAVFEGPIDFTNTEEPVRATIEWEPTSLVWEKSGPMSQPLTVEDFNFSQERLPRLEANVRNDSLESVSNVELTALLYNETGSIFAASKTFVTSAPAGSVSPIIFTWPEKLPSEPIEVKVLIRILPDQSYLR